MSKRDEILLKSEKPKVQFEALKDGKIRMTCSTWESERVLLADEVDHWSSIRGLRIRTACPARQRTRRKSA